jgi:NDMA-dependent alcohol dehydrogenase
MKTTAAVLWEVGAPWSVEEIELDPPLDTEVLVRMVASGMCHTDEHLVTGDLPSEFPIVGGHEGAGVVEAVGIKVTRVRPGDRVIFSFIPSCGVCPSCSTGYQNLCDLGALLGLRKQIFDGTSRHHARGQDLGLMCLLGTFSHHTVVNELSCMKLELGIPLELACLLGCGVVTGWGSAVYAAQTGPGDVVAVVGAGGIGMNAIQGARLSGAKQIWAIDPLPHKQKAALASFGATHAPTTIEEALEPIREASWGRMCNKVIMTAGVGSGLRIAEALALTGKNGRVVITNVHPSTETTVDASMLDLVLMQKQLVGSCFGSANPQADIPQLIELYLNNQLNLEDLVTNTYALEDVNQGYEDLRSGKNIRGVLRLGDDPGLGDG